MDTYEKLILLVALGLGFMTLICLLNWYMRIRTAGKIVKGGVDLSAKAGGSIYNRLKFWE